MKHTPGPWKVAEHYGAFRVITASRSVALALYDGGSEDGEVMPNARLIASAPELLYACRILVRRIMQDVNATGADTPSEVITAQAAIAKATEDR